MKRKEVSRKQQIDLTEDSLRSFEVATYKCEDLTVDDLTACFDLVKTNLIDMYKNSKLGWHPKSKLKEMREKGLIYIIIKTKNTQTTLTGFISFMVTIETDECVIYCYELQLSQDLRGRGLGKLLLNKMEQFSSVARVSKSMLTVFSANPAVKFYSKFGYKLSPTSPEAKVLRNGVVKTPSYFIMEKELLT
ncbi:acyl-CoA N-acyltransferase [Lipomyces arxii]|uniref:acyl-CoA N-acyltransferase n=1 Tax=Lipomyces arxii TaxID=56418 RepID=UPI0034CD29D6